MRPEPQVPLTAMTHGGGCACKLSSTELRDVVSGVIDHEAFSNPRLLVGASSSDDAGVWALGPDRALVQTVDFFTPVVDDPYDWGRIAAANALSDVYAMGGEPTTALQLLGWPRGDLHSGRVKATLQGGAAVMAEARCVIVGGHSIDSPEPLYGFAVTGEVRPDRVVTNAGAQPGDLLYLTKPLGIGIATTAIKRGVAPPALVKEAVDVMTTLNREASRAMVAAGAHAATDITGFGFLGHLWEMLQASGVAAEIDPDKIPVLPSVADLARSGVFPAGSARNLAAANGYTDFGHLPEEQRRILADAQTSGGLLIAIPPERVEERGITWPAVGRMVAGNPQVIVQEAIMSVDQVG